MDLSVLLYTDYYDYCYSVDTNNDTGLCVQLTRQALSIGWRELSWGSVCYCILISAMLWLFFSFLFFKWQNSVAPSSGTCHALMQALIVAILQPNETTVILSALVCSSSPGLFLHISRPCTWTCVYELSCRTHTSMTSVFCPICFLPSHQRGADCIPRVPHFPVCACRLMCADTDPQFVPVL